MRIDTFEVENRPVLQGTSFGHHSNQFQLKKYITIDIE
jgi:hypothetical protein